MVYAIAGAGFYNMEEQISAMSPMEVSRLDALLRRWKGRRRYGHFYRDLFEKNGYTCEQFFRQCYYGHEVIPCCDIFRSHYVMLRGRCFRMAKFYQEDPDALGRLTFFLNNLSSPLAEQTGVQQQIIAYFVGKNVDIPTFPRLYISQGDYFRVKLLARRTVLLPWNPHCSTYPEDQ
ncbi:Protein DEL-7, partial [Aphelenchoides avenae]